MKDEKFVFIMEMYGQMKRGTYFRGIIADHEMEARQIAALRGHQIKSLVRVEKLIEAEETK